MALMAKRSRLDSPYSQLEGLNPEDRISKLPDDILAYILSFMTVKEAVITSVLAKRWRYSWVSLKKLNFEEIKPFHKVPVPRDEGLKKTQEYINWLINERAKYVVWVNNVLKLHNAPTVYEFRVCFDLDKSASNDIDGWLKFAFTKGVERLELDFSDEVEGITYPPLCYNFPVSLLDQSRNAFISFKSLKSLFLKSVNVTGKIVEFILSQSPLLEKISVYGSENFGSLKVSGPSLMLKYLDLYCLYGAQSIEISDINLVSFSYTGRQLSLLVKDTPRLVEVSIRGVILWCVRYVFIKLAYCFSQVEVLTLGFDDMDEFSKLNEVPRFPKLKHLVIQVMAWKNDSLLLFTSLIRASPSLETFVLNVQWMDPVSERLEFKTLPNCPHHCLKVVELHGYSGHTSDVELAFYFFDNAVALEKIIIDPRDPKFTPSYPKTNDKIFKEEGVRKVAKRQLELRKPAGVKLVIL